MRVITGSARGRKLLTLEGEEVRPTAERVKEAVFSIIQFEIEGRRVLDLFGGSGQLGIEALSRGAEKAVFVDASSEAVDIIRKNLNKCGFESQSVVLNTDAFSYLASGARGDVFDIVFLDPPYSKGLPQKALPEVEKHMSAGGVILCETPADEELPEEVGNFCIAKTYKYGKIKITLYRSRDVAKR